MYNYRKSNTRGTYKNKGHSFRRPGYRKYQSRSQSPVFGSQEYMDKKIEQTSAIIMKQLLDPNHVNPTQELISVNNTEEPTFNLERESDKATETNCPISKTKKKPSTVKAGEIHTQIMCRLINMNEGRKKNLINSYNSGYDATIEHFVKQQRLEISSALRNICSSHLTKEQSEMICSVIPDIGIKIEELPRDVIEELSHTFGDDNCIYINGFLENTLNLGNCSSHYSKVLL